MVEFDHFKIAKNNMGKTGKMLVQQREVSLLLKDEKDFISLTDIAKYRNEYDPFAIINNWMRGRATLAFLGLWETLNNPGFKPLEFERFKNEAGHNYFVLIHTDAIKVKILPEELTREQSAMIYASEADMLNVALFGKTAQQWRDENHNAEGNIRDYATLEQLVVLSNMESINAVLIYQGLKQKDRIIQLNQTAIIQLKSLFGNKHLEKLISP